MSLLNCVKLSNFSLKFQVDISSVKNDSNLEFRRSQVVNSEEIHVSTASSPTGLSGPRPYIVPTGKSIGQVSEERLSLVSLHDNLL